MRKDRQVTVTYSILGDDGYIVDKLVKFSTTSAAYQFIKALKLRVGVVGRPAIDASY